MSKVKAMVRLNMVAKQKFQKIGRSKPEMYLGNNKVGIDWSEVEFDSQEIADKHLNSIECGHFMEVKDQKKLVEQEKPAAKKKRGRKKKVVSEKNSIDFDSLFSSED